MVVIIIHSLLVFRSFNDSMNSLTGGKKPWLTKLSSAGLVYLHFGHRIISTITGEASPTLELLNCCILCVHAILTTLNLIAVLSIHLQCTLCHPLLDVRFISPNTVLECEIWYRCLGKSVLRPAEKFIICTHP